MPSNRIAMPQRSVFLVSSLAEGGGMNLSFSSLGTGIGTTTPIPLEVEAPEMALFRAVERKDPSVRFVGMDQEQTVHIEPGKRFTFFTAGLCGCTAVLLVAQKPDGSTVATINHYSPLKSTAHAFFTEREATRHHANLPDGTSYSLIVSTPGDWERVGEKWEMRPVDLELARQIVASVKRVLGEQVQSRVSPYKKSKAAGESSALILRIGRVASYQACEEYGRLPL